MAPSPQKNPVRGQEFHTYSQRLALPPTGYNGEALRFDGNTCSLNLFLNVPDTNEKSSPI